MIGRVEGRLQRLHLFWTTEGHGEGQLQRLHLFVRGGRGGARRRATATAKPFFHGGPGAVL